ncbi:MAG: DUF4830 domain-containing protein [Oscillospiraceae bacterium]|nr:DUF4830 domain-containing protein [Oscillospiraceae bacterium]
MFVVTAKLNKKKIVACILILAAILIFVIILTNMGSRAATSGLTALSAVVKSNENRVEYLQSLGWEVVDEPLEEQEITIPKEFNDIYSQYNELQKTQGFDLQEYAGMRVTRYTYQVTNYPNNSDTVVADILVYKNQVIGGDVQSTALDGFMQGLEYPA